MVGAGRHQLHSGIKSRVFQRRFFSLISTNRRCEAITIGASEPSERRLIGRFGGASKIRQARSIEFATTTTSAFQKKE
jgi:hypothetical protein